MFSQNLPRLYYQRKLPVMAFFHTYQVLFSKNDIVVYRSDTSNERTNIKAKNIVIATGSCPSSLPGIEIDEKNIVSSTGALSFSEVPKNLIAVTSFN